MAQSHADIKIQDATATIKDTQNPASSLGIHYVEALPQEDATNKGIILLIHGFPQTSHQFRHVLPLFAKAGYRVIAPDYRGAGGSSKVHGLYTKEIMATDLHHLVKDHLQITEPIHVVGHDIGGMIAHPYAVLYPEHTKTVTWGECPLPGSKFYEEIRRDVTVFHFLFHMVPELPEALIAGKEDVYLKHFFDKLSYNKAAITKDDFNEYVRAYSQKDAISCGIGVYRAFEEDADQNREWRKQKGKSKVPALLLSGDKSFLQERAEEMAGEFYENYEVRTVDESSHWIAEENPKGFADAVLGFVQKH